MSFYQSRKIFCLILFVSREWSMTDSGNFSWMNIYFRLQNVLRNGMFSSVSEAVNHEDKIWDFPLLVRVFTWTQNFVEKINFLLICWEFDWITGCNCSQFDKQSSFLFRKVKKQTNLLSWNCCDEWFFYWVKLTSVIGGRCGNWTSHDSQALMTVVPVLTSKLTELRVIKLLQLELKH